MSKSPRPHPSLLPSPFPADDPPLFPDTPSAEHPDDLDHGMPYIDADDDQLLPPPNFAPFFTVIEDSATGEHYHPSVHYIFADDDQEILTAASMRELGFDDARPQPQPPTPSDSATASSSSAAAGPAAGVEESSSAAVVSPLPPAKPNVKERYLLFDIGPDGQSVTDAQSMSREWQIGETTIRSAPTWDEEALETGGAGLMLKVAGFELPGNGRAAGAATANKEMLGAAKQESGNDILGALDVLAARFERGVGAMAKMTGQVAGESAGRSRGVSLSGV